MITAFERRAADRDLHAMVTGHASGSNFEIELMAEREMVCLISANSAQTRDIIGPAPDKYRAVWSITPCQDAHETEMVPVPDAPVAFGALILPNKNPALISSAPPGSRTITDRVSASFAVASPEVTSTDLLPFGQINDWRAFLRGVRAGQRRR